MNVLIVENEKPAVETLSRLLKRIDTEIIIVASTETVVGTVNWLQENPSPDLILMDIQLDDGLCFEVFDTIQVDIPVIFTTAYDEFTLKAFKVNSVDYLLKPISQEALVPALEKFKKNFYPKKIIETIDFKQIFKDYSNQYKSRFLIKIGTKYKSISVNDANYFHINERNTFINVEKGRDYGIDYSLDHLQKILDPNLFFRINRNCIVNINSIKEMVSYSSSRLQVRIHNDLNDENFVISRDKVGEFKKWIDR